MSSNQSNATIHLCTVYCRTLVWTVNDEQEMTRTNRSGPPVWYHLGICRKWLRISFIYARVHRPAKNLEATSNCTCPKGDIQFHSEDQRLLGASVQNLLALTTRRKGFVHLYIYVFYNDAVSGAHYTASKVKIKLRTKESGSGPFQSIITTST